LSGQAADLRRTIGRLSDYCQKNDWAGFDPYDALNSQVFARTPFAGNRYCRIGLTQLLKRLPVNIRPILGVKKEQNAKAIALFLSAALKLSRQNVVETKGLSNLMVERLVALRSPDTEYWCWGYSFPWQTRTVVVPRGAPNLVCTCFVANALLDAYGQDGDSRLLRMAISAADYLLNVLYWADGKNAGFSYPLPGSHTRVHNANLLGAQLLCRISAASGDAKFLDAGLTVARCAVRAQRPDGSWPYGELPTQQWIDNFHTGYNLCALRSISECGSTDEFDVQTRRGFDFYLDHFISKDGAVPYFHDRTYPIDIHCVAQSLITLVDLRELCADSISRATAIVEWAMTHMWDERGFFYYRQSRGYVNRIAYMRWSQAWMLLALATLLEAVDGVDAGGAGSSHGI
jgi:hypothetical protein